MLVLCVCINLEIDMILTGTEYHDYDKQNEGNKLYNIINQDKNYYHVMFHCIIKLSNIEER